MVFSDRHAGGINYPKGGVGTIARKLVSALSVTAARFATRLA